jgi:hypothetical protein
MNLALRRQFLIQSPQITVPAKFINGPLGNRLRGGRHGSSGD